MENLGDNLTPKERGKLIRQRVAKRQHAKLVHAIQDATRMASSSKKSTELPSAHEPNTEAEPRTPTVDIAELIEALTLYDGIGGQPLALTPEVTSHFNQTLGGILDDETLLSNLHFPNSAEARRIGDVDKRKKALNVSPQLRANFNKAIDVAVRHKLRTVGDVRRIDYNTIYRIDNLGEKAGVFLLNAFKPLPKT